MNIPYGTVKKKNNIIYFISVTFCYIVPNCFICSTCNSILALAIFTSSCQAQTQNLPYRIGYSQHYVEDPYQKELKYTVYADGDSSTVTYPIDLPAYFNINCMNFHHSQSARIQKNQTWKFMFDGQGMYGFYSKETQHLTRVGVSATKEFRYRYDFGDGDLIYNDTENNHMAFIRFTVTTKDSIYFTVNAFPYGVQINPLLDVPLNLTKSKYAILVQTPKHYFTIIPDSNSIIKIPDWLFEAEQRYIKVFAFHQADNSNPIEYCERQKRLMMYTDERMEKEK